MLFLYNEMDNVLKYASYSSRVFEEIGSITPEPKLSIKNLFTIADQVPSHHIYDASYYFLYIKSDYIEKEFMFYDKYRKNYSPFEPILKTFDVQKEKELQEEIERRMNENDGNDI